jgi:hypothetical protein
MTEHRVSLDKKAVHGDDEMALLGLVDEDAVACHDDRDGEVLGVPPN